MPILGDFAIKYSSHAEELGVSTDDLYRALVDTAENTVSIFYHTLISRTRLINDFVIAASRLVSGYSFFVFWEFRFLIFYISGKTKHCVEAIQLHPHSLGRSFWRYWIGYAGSISDFRGKWLTFCCVVEIFAEQLT